MEFFRVFLKNPINEKLICYTLNPGEAINIEPNPLLFFAGEPEEAAVLEVSEYYVTQIQKESLENNELLEAAFELQKEALWSRCKLNNKLYLRRLAESSSENHTDNSPAIQLWRPIADKVFTA